MFLVLLIFTCKVYASDAKGPHGGKLLSQGSVAIEVTIFEKNMPPHFRIYLYNENQLIAPGKAQLVMNLMRFNQDNNRITFSPVDNFLQSDQVIEEPHSFDVEISLILDNKTYEWKYSAYEGRVTINPKIAVSAGIKTAIAGPIVLKKKLDVIGKIEPNNDFLAPIYPRYPGIIKTVNKQLGDNVSKGDILASIESNESLQVYFVNAPISGTIIQKSATIGELAKANKPIYKIANLDTVWVDLTVYRKEASLVKKGLEVIITGDNGSPRVVSHLDYIAPIGIEDSQTILARATLNNINRIWLPGMYINAVIIYAKKEVAVAVPLTALQRWWDRDVVFLQRGDQYQASPVELGERNDYWVEILSGIKPGDSYVAENSFFLKADLGKAGASHEH